MENQPKISLVEAYYLIAFALLADLIHMIPVVNWLVGAVTIPAYQFYYYLKGVRGVAGLAGNLIGLIPLLNLLPTITAGVIATIILDRVAIAKKLAQKSRDLDAAHGTPPAQTAAARPAPVSAPTAATQPATSPERVQES